LNGIEISIGPGIISAMPHYDYAKHLHAAWEKAVRQYREGRRGSATFFSAEETKFLDSIGLTAQEVYDFAEDFVNGGEPDFATFAAIHDIRRAYFLEVQNGRRSAGRIEPASLPAKDAHARGIRWLPRILPKARAKLRGELHPDIMYACGGDRAFLREHDIHPAEFLRVVWQHEGSDEAVLDWVEQRSRRAHAGAGKS
jgi:hypothetical protein